MLVEKTSAEILQAKKDSTVIYSYYLPEIFIDSHLFSICFKGLPKKSCIIITVDSKRFSVTDSQNKFKYYTKMCGYSASKFYFPLLYCS